MSRILKGESFYDRYGVDPTGLVLWFDQSDARSYGDNSIWYDLSGNGNHGKQATAAKQPVIIGAGGLAGTARQFDGVDDYINCGGDTSLAITDAITIEIWLNPYTFTNAGGANYPTLLGKGSNDNYRVFFYQTGSAIFRLAGTIDCSFNYVFSTGEWVYMVGTWDGNTMITFVDGEKRQSTPKTGVLPIGGELWIGNWNYTGSGRFFEGFISIVRTWKNRALSPAEIQRLYLKDAPRFGKL